MLSLTHSSSSPEIGFDRALIVLSAFMLFRKTSTGSGRNMRFGMRQDKEALKINACDSDVILIALRSAYGQILDRGSRSVGKMSERTAL